MSLKSSNQVATNRYQLEIELPGDVFEKAVEHNTTMIQSVQEHKFRQYFFAKLGKRNFQKLVQESLEPTYYSRVIRKLLNWKKTEKNGE